MISTMRVISWLFVRALLHPPTDKLGFLPLLNCFDVQLYFISFWSLCVSITVPQGWAAFILIGVWQSRPMY